MPDPGYGDLPVTGQVAMRLRDAIATAASLDELEELVERAINLQVTGEWVPWPDGSGRIGAVRLHALIAQRRSLLRRISETSRSGVPR